MRKALSIILSLVLIIGTIFAVPVFSVSAEGAITGFDYANGSWNVTKNAGGTVTPNASAKTVSFTGTQYQSIYTTVSNLEVGALYEFYFDVSPNANFQIWAVPGDEALAFSGVLPSSANRIHLGNSNGSKCQVQFTANHTSYHIVFRNELNSAATTAFTFSNIMFEKASAETVAGVAIANGDWNITKNAGGTVTKSKNTVKFTGAQSQTMYTKLTDLTANTVYKLTFDVSANMNTQVWLLDGDATVQFTIDGTVPANATGLAAVNGTKATVEFTAEKDSYYVFFRNALSTNGTTEFTFSNFKLITVRTLTEAELAGKAVANGFWDVTKNAGGTATKSNNTVSITGAQYQTMYTKITDLTVNTVYKLTFDVSSRMKAQTWMSSGDVAPSFSGTVPNNAAFLVYTEGTTATVEFIAETTSVYLYFRNEFDTAATTSYTFSNFALETVKTLTEEDLAGNAIADGTWKVTAGTASNNKATHTVSLKNVGYQSAYTTLTNLKANTIYELSFDMSAVSADCFKQLWLVSGIENIAFSNSISGYPENNLGSAKVTVEGNRFTATFTANEESYHIVIRNLGGSVANVDFKNFSFKAVKTLTEAEIAGKEIAANGAWDVTKNAGGTVTKSNDTVKFTGAQYQDVSLPLTGLNPNTTYTLSFINSSSGIELFANTVYVIPGETAYAESLKSKEGTITYYCETNNKVNDDGAIVTTVRFTTDDANANYLIVFHNDNVSEVTLSNFEFSSETAYEFKGTAIRANSENVEQGMRFKNTISKDLLANGYNGLEVVEYGNIAAYESQLDADFTYENAKGGVIKKGVAYNKENGTNVVFAEDDDSVDYTVVLTGINPKYYDRNCVVRSYVLLSDGSVIYGDVQTYSVFAMFNAILNGDNDSDKTVVNNILADAEIAAAYDAWLAK